MLLGQGFPGPDYQASLRHYDPYWSICQWMSIPWYRWIIIQVVTIAVRCSRLRLICVMIPNGVQSWSAPNGCRDKGHGQLLRLFSNDKTDRNLHQPARGPQFFSRASLDQLFGWRSKWHHNHKNKYDEIIQHPTGLQESPSFHFRPGKWRKLSAFGSSLKDQVDALPRVSMISSDDSMIQTAFLDPNSRLSSFQIKSSKQQRFPRHAAATPHHAIDRDAVLRLSMRPGNILNSLLSLMEALWDFSLRKEKPSLDIEMNRDEYHVLVGHVNLRGSCWTCSSLGSVVQWTYDQLVVSPKPDAKAIRGVTTPPDFYSQA